VFSFDGFCSIRTIHDKTNDRVLYVFQVNEQILPCPGIIVRRSTVYTNAHDFQICSMLRLLVFLGRVTCREFQNYGAHHRFCSDN